MREEFFKRSHYHFDLPPELIAQHPVIPRDASRLLVLDRSTGKIAHHQFDELGSFLEPGDLLVANNSKVIPARLLGRRILDDGTLGGQVEFFLLEEVEPLVWDGLFKASGKAKPGFQFRLGDHLEGELVTGVDLNGTVRARFSRDPVASGVGRVPLPPYIKRTEALEEDLQTYQTVYAKTAGSSAAPTAGLHFTPEILDRLQNQGVGWKEVTLHVGVGTFRPVKVDDIREHPMHEERFEIPRDVAQAVKDCCKRVVAVGTTSVRSLETPGALEKQGPQRTSIFIYPQGLKFQQVDALITNFHLPESTLLMLVCAFGGYDLVMRAYEEAVREKYRFFSYGDAMLIL